MSATLEWNRLTIAAQGDAEFKTAVDKNLGDLLKTSFPQLEIDIGQCTGLGDEAFKLIGLKLVDAAGNRRLVVRVAEDMRRYFEGSGLHELVDVYVIERMDANTRIGDDGEDDGEGEVSELAPMSEIASIEKEDTAPPSELVGVTGAQGIATGGVLVDDEDGRRYPVAEELVVGREAPASAIYQIPTISKRHFRIYAQGPAYFIEDLRSTNGTYLNGDPLTQPHPLDEGDEIVVAITLKHPEGARRFKFTTKG
jgi:hypothetical protein